ncbi:hypothetical protein M441DRAFT_208190 [Trichoderma asperellum CBS 433.97]|uniref:Secreted protein n=1 Tax=Trichoderma asperellum (strain ATCC 204424 / CBS 433.97 / NBRC 101777) TaxID=1042311 RepID=A0A2T3ZMK5_TRIA4|nr:hypothetical protein M441DRAFT_208190 [Trichoderma asperellum CBS 433.97]PTB46038.1 hypothetical protein M441DRAFT_208190 [Trichoderma asperellum CBS 433.97]
MLVLMLLLMPLLLYEMAARQKTNARQKESRKRDHWMSQSTCPARARDLRDVRQAVCSASSAWTAVFRWSVVEACDDLLLRWLWRWEPGTAVGIFLKSQLMLHRQLHQPPRSITPNHWVVLPLLAVFMGQQYQLQCFE